MAFRSFTTKRLKSGTNMFRNKRFLPRRFGNAPVVASGPTVVATDNFNRADDITLGSNWTLMNSAQPNILRVVSNQCKSPSSGTGAAYWNANALNNNQYTKLTIVTVDHTFNTSFGVICRATGTAATDNFSGYAFYTDGTTWVLARYDTGTKTNLATGSATFVANDIIEIRANGTTITGYQNGSPVASASATDSNYASGSGGLIVVNGGTIDGISDNWEGGNL